MNSTQNEKVFTVVAPGAQLKGASATCNVIDCAGYESVVIDVVLGTTDVALTALKLQESDVKASATSLTSGVDATGYVYGTSADISGAVSVLPSASDGNKTYSFIVDARYRKRYLLPVITAAAGTNGVYLACQARLHRAEIADTTAAARGRANIVGGG